MRANGGYLTAADLAAHRSEWVEPVSTNYRGYDVWELPPNSQGIAALQMLNILEAYDLKSMGFGSADYLHLFVEAKKLAFEDRARYYADPEFAKIPLKELLSKAYAAKRRALIDLNRAALEYPADAKALEQGDTIYLTVAEGRQHGLADPEQLPRLRLGHDARRAAASSCRTAASCSRSRTATPTSTRRASGRSTRSFPPSSPRTASRGCRSA